MLGNSSAELELEVVQRNLAILHVGGGRGWFRGGGAGAGVGVSVALWVL